MTVAVETIDEPRTMTIEVNGKLTEEDYERFLPLIENRIEQFGPIRLMVVLNDFQGWEMSAFWEDIKFDFQHFNDIERLAIVGDKKWEKGMSVLCRPFTTADIQFFNHEDRDKAVTWLAE